MSTCNLLLATWCLQMSTCNLKGLLVTSIFILVTCKYPLVTSKYLLLTSKFQLVTCKFIPVTCKYQHKLVTCKLQLVASKLVVLFGHRMFSGSLKATIPFNALPW